MTLLFTIFALVFITELISWVGKSVLLDLAFTLYTSAFNSTASARRKSLQKTVLADKAEMGRTSSQDQFAKWAKLRRKVDKGIADLEKLNGEIASDRTAFSIKFNTALWLMTTGTQFFVGWWYRKQAVFYLPEGWMGPATWWLALPFAPKGSVSCGAWQMACRRSIKSVERLVRDLYLQEGGSVDAPPPQQQQNSSTRNGNDAKIKVGVS